MPSREPCVARLRRRLRRRKSFGRAQPPDFFKNRGVLVPLRAILAIERPTKLMSDLPETTVIQGEHYNSGDLEYFSVTGQWLII